MHLVTREVVRECEAGLKGVNIGIFTLNCMHTSAGLTVSCSARHCYRGTLLYFVYRFPAGVFAG